MSFRLYGCGLLLALGVQVAAWASPPARWAPFGPDGGDARRIAPDPKNHDHLYLGTANGWIYESRDAGNDWVRLAQLGRRDDLVLDSIVVDAQNPKHLVVGAWVIDRPDGGIYISSDGGATWTIQAEMRGQSVLALTVSSADPKILVAGTLQGVFRSTDGGQRWTRISPDENKEIHNIQSVAIDPRNPDTIYAGTWHLPWKTTDGGAHWENIGVPQGMIDDSDVFSIIVDPVQSQTVYASACSGIYKSENAGAMFHKVQGIPASARRTRKLLEDPHRLETVFAGTTEGLYRSEDAGKTWMRTTGPELIVNDVAVSLDNPKRVLIATDRGGVMASDDGGDTFHPSNNGFSARQITAMKRDTTRPSALFVGVVNDKDWGGVFESDNGGQSWVQRSDGLAGRDVFSLGQAPNGTMIAGTAHGIFRLDAASQTWQRVEAAPSAPPPPDAVQKVGARAPAARKPGSAKGARSSRQVHTAKAHAGAALTRTASSSRAKLAAAKASTKPAPATAPAAKDPVVDHGFDGSVYAIASADTRVLATTSIGLLGSTDNGVTWTSNGPSGRTAWRFVAAAKHNVVIATATQIALSQDSGAHWVPVRLPDGLTQVSAVAVETTGHIWAGGREGVFVSNDGGSSWNVPENLKLASVNSIFYDADSDRITITTSGNNSVVFSVSLPQMHVAVNETGWSLRFARSMGDHLIAATLYDGIVVQPRMLASPMAPPAQAEVDAARHVVTQPNRD